MKPLSSSSDDNQDALGEFARQMKAIKSECPVAGKEGRAALDRLAAAAYGSNGSQATIIAQFLASLYNGGDALPVRLDHVGRLDWSLRKDVAAVILGIYNERFSDSAIRQAFAAVGGDQAVEFLHWHTSGGPARAALQRLVAHFVENRDSLTLELLRAINDCGNRARVGQLVYCDKDLGQDFVCVLDARVGAHRGQLEDAQVTEIFSKAGITDAIFAADRSTSRV